MAYREIEFGFGACTVCDKVVEWRKRRIRGTAVLATHGPRGNRCPGGGQPGKPWLEATGLPCWYDMSDLDKGAALMHVWKRKREGAIYARENYPCEYIEHPDLIALSRFEACRHAATVCGRNDEIQDKLGIDEWDRLYNLALGEGQKILDARKLWGVRYEHGSVLPCATEDYARACAKDLYAVALLSRTEIGGEWSVVEDLLGVEIETDIRRVREGDHVGARTVISSVNERRTGGCYGAYDVHVITFDTDWPIEVHGSASPTPDADRVMVRVRRRAGKPEGAKR